MIEASAGKQATDISQIVKLGLEHLKRERKFDYEDVRVQPVSGTLYNGMKALFRGDSVDASAETDSTASAGPSIKLMPGGKSAWEIGTGGPYVRAKSITVFFERDEDGKVITVSPSMTFPTAPVTEVDQAFRFHSPGVYIFTLDAVATPSRCEIELIVDTDGVSKPQIFKGDWPQENLYYLLLIDKFIGDRRVLFETLKNNRVVGNGLKDVQTVESATISLATFIDSIDTGTSGWDDERHYHVRVKKPDDKFPKRAWLYFPLDAETAKTEMARIKSICGLGAEDRQLFLESIRSSAVLANTDTSLINQKATTSVYGSTAPTSVISPRTPTNASNPNLVTSTVNPNATTSVINPKTGATGINPSSATGLTNPNTATSSVNPRTTTTGTNPYAGASSVNPKTGTTGINPNATTTAVNPNAATSAVNPRTGTTGISPNATTSAVGSMAATNSMNPNAPPSLFIANSAPAWFEIPAESKTGSSFARILEIGIDPAVPITAEATYGLAIYEFNDEVILSIGNSYVQLTEHPRWADGVRKLSVIISSSPSTPTTPSTTPPTSTSP